MAAFIRYILLLFPLSLAAQQENWDAYISRYNNKPCSILVDLALVHSAPDHLLPYLVVTGPRAHTCTGKEGLLTPSEIQELEGILDVTGGYLGGVTARKLAGTLTYNCERLNYYYVRDTTGVRNAIRRMYATNYGTYEYTLHIKSDPQWTAYSTFLYPDSTTKSWMKTSRSIIDMRKQGQDISQPHPLHYKLGFRSDSARENFRIWSGANGFTFVSNNQSQQFGMPFDLTISRSCWLRTDSIMAVESLLTEQARLHSGYYAGWEAVAMPAQKK